MKIILDAKQNSSYHKPMNRLPASKIAQILNMLVEGSSMRSTARVCDVAFNSVARVLVDAGTVCAKFHDENVRNVKSKRIQCDEIWSFCYAKEKNVETAKAAPEGAGDVWTWTALDADSKLIVSYLVGGRDGGSAMEFMQDVAARLANRVQLTTDGHKAYLDAVEEAFGCDIDYAMLVKLYGAPKGKENERRYSPAECNGTIKGTVSGSPEKQHISTSFVERQNLTMRMSMRRFTRLTNAFSKKLENHYHMLALYFMHYNFCRIHKSLKVTPAMQAGLSTTAHGIEFIVDLMEKAEAAPRKRGSYKTKNSN
jgi:IS1 family transposase